MINEQFHALPEEKRLRIINAGFEVFGSNEYKRASTDLIAAKADISKGLLFYYFHNKKCLYVYLAEYAAALIKDSVVDEHFSEINDFFELIEYMSMKKLALMIKNPHIFDFFMRAFSTKEIDISKALNDRGASTTNDIYDLYFSKLDTVKFKPGVNPMEIFQMLAWMVEGYMHEKQWLGLQPTLTDIMERYCSWSDTFKKLTYKEEYIV